MPTKWIKLGDNVAFQLSKLSFISCEFRVLVLVVDGVRQTVTAEDGGAAAGMFAFVLEQQETQGGL